MGISMAQKLGQTGEDAAMQMGQLAGQLKDDTAFKGYGVTTGLGTSTVNADGSTDYGVGQDAGLQGAANSSLAASQQAQQNAMQDYTQREQDIYNRAMAMQNPMLDSGGSTGE
jgi:membrane protease subunit (stomatin/prohibitin family)